MSAGLRVHVEALPDVGVEGGATAFDDLYRECRRDLVSYCDRQLAGQGDAEAVAQEAFVRAWTSFDRFSPGRPFWPWLATIARRLCVDQRRRLHREVAHVRTGMVGMASSPLPSPEESVETQEEYRSVSVALRRLKPVEQRIITLRDVNGWSYEEIARFEGVTVEAIRGSLKRARTSLRRSYASVADAAPVALGGSVLARLRMRLSRFVARRGASSAPAWSAPSAYDAVVGLAALAVATGGMAHPSAVPPPIAVSTTASAAQEPVGEHGHAAAADRREVSPPRAVSPTVSEPPVGSDGPSLPQLLDDGGDTPEATRVTAMTVSPNVARDRTVFASATVLGCAYPPCAALFRSTDAGGSWQRLSAVGLIGGEVHLSPSYPADDRIFVAGPGGLQVSDDDGATFHTVVPIPGEVAVSPRFAADDRRILVGGAPLWEYRDDVSVVAPARYLLGPSTTTGGVAFDPDSNGRRVLVGGTVPDQGGRQAATVYACDEALCEHAGPLGTVVGAPSLAVSRRAAFAWRGTSLFQSHDGGRSFSPVSLPRTGTVADVAFSPSGHVYVALAPSGTPGDGGLLTSRDDGKTWAVVGAGSPLGRGTSAVAVLDDRTMLAAPALESGSGILCSVDSGSTWRARCEG